MRLSIVVLFCLAIAVVNSATARTTLRRVVTTAARATTKAPAPKSAYAYLRTVRGKNSCASGSCPFWERHGRSFAALRCYSQQYQECTCLHRMCFSSCMFTRETCNEEMVSCLQQICPRCMPASAAAMCSVYDSMATRVAEALSAFACYPCCPNLNGANNSAAIETNTVSELNTIAPEFPTPSDVIETESTDPLLTDEYPEQNIDEQSPNGENSGLLPGSGDNSEYYPSNNGNEFGLNGNGVAINGEGNTNVNGNPNGNGNNFLNGNGNGIVNNNGNVNGAVNGNPNGALNGNGNPNGALNGNGNGNGAVNGNGNGAVNNGNGNGAVNGNGNGVLNNGNGNGAVNNGNGNGAVNNGNGNGNVAVNSIGSGNGVNCNTGGSYPGVVFPGSDAIFYNNNFPNRNQQVVKQRARLTVRTTKRRLATTRRTPVTTRRPAPTAAAVRGNKVTNVNRKPVQAQKKPQSNDHIQS